MNEFSDVTAKEELDRYGNSGGFATTREVSDKFGWSPGKIRLLCKQGKLEYLFDPTCTRPTYLVQRASLAKVLRSGKATAQRDGKPAKGRRPVVSDVSGSDD